MSPTSRRSAGTDPIEAEMPSPMPPTSGGGERFMITFILLVFILGIQIWSSINLDNKISNLSNGGNNADAFANLNAKIGTLQQDVQSLGSKLAAGQPTAPTQPTADDLARQREEQARQEREAAKKLKPVTDGEYVRGNRAATVTLVEYSDFECPFCKRLQPTVEQLFAKYDGKIRLVHRHFPLPFHNAARPMAVAAECAGEIGGNDAFWKYSNALYDKGPLTTADALTALAKEQGLDEAKFKTCAASSKYNEKIEQDLREGAEAGVQGTPATFIVNSKTGEIIPVSGAQPIEAFTQVIDGMLK